MRSELLDDAHIAAPADAQLVSEDRLVAIADVDPAVLEIAHDVDERFISGDIPRTRRVQLVDKARSDLGAYARCSGWPRFERRSRLSSPRTISAPA